MSFTNKITFKFYLAVSFDVYNNMSFKLIESFTCNITFLTSIKK